MKPAVALILSLALLGAGGASARSLVIYCSHDPDACELAARTFQRETGIDTSVTRKATGEVFAQIRAERANPKADVWYGGTFDPFLQAAAEGLFVSYRSPRLAELQPWARRATERADYKVAAIYRIIIGFGTDPTILRQKELAAPRCWSDLVSRAYGKEIELASGLGAEDRIIIAPPDGLADGDQVRVTGAKGGKPATASEKQDVKG